MTATREAARLLDAEDPLASVRKLFSLPEQVIYLDGNSLGPLPAGVLDRLTDVVNREWGEHLIRAWNQDGWWAAPRRVGDQVGRLLGAAAGQTVVGETTSVQIFNALTAAARLRPGRGVLVTDPAHFPTDRYIADSVARLLGLRVVAVSPPELPRALSELAEQVAVVAYPAVDYRTGELWDIAGVTAAAHQAGAVVVWDLCHAAGAVPVRLDADQVDIAVGCSYKFLSGGPGAPAFIYVAARHHDAFDQPLTGWNGHTAPFEMTSDYQPAADIEQARIGTPHILSLLAFETALSVFDHVEMAAVRAKSQSLGDFFLDCVDRWLAPLGFEVVTPREPERRGSQLTLRHSQAYPMMAALIERGVIGDVRPPNLLRFGFNALYVSHTDLYEAVTHLRQVAVSGEYAAARFQVRQTVT